MSEYAFQGDQFWQKRAPFAGQVPAFKDPQEMYEAALEAFNWLHEHPLREQVAFHYKGTVVKSYVTKMRPFTWKAVAMCMGIGEAAFKAYRNKDDFAPVVQWITDVIHTQKFEGAATGLLNANFIARDLGMADRSELTGKDGGPLKTQDVTDEEKLLDEARRLGIPLESFGLSGEDAEGEEAGA